MCCIISDEPIENERYYTAHGGGRVKFQTDMLNSPFKSCTSCIWCFGQLFPLSSGVTQCMLRRKVLKYDMNKYSCFQGYVTICCCIRGGSCHEEKCPDFCNFLEGCFCNCVAVSVSRQYVMEEYNLESDPCDYRLIRINNCIQCLACICDILAIIDQNFQELARIVDFIADLFYHAVSGCMTAQVSHELDHHAKLRSLPVITSAISIQTNPMMNTKEEVVQKY